MRGPFDELSPLQIRKIFDILSIHAYSYKKNQSILSKTNNENIIAIVMSGKAKIINIEYNGNEIVSEELSQNSVFGTSISGINSDSCEIIAKEDTQIVVIDYNKLLDSNNLKYSYFNVFIRNLFEIINTKFRENNERLKVLEKKQIRDRLLEYFEFQYKKSGSRNIYLPFTLKSLADYLAINRSAMFRELRNLKEDKLIEIKDKRITLLYKNRLL